MKISELHKRTVLKRAISYPQKGEEPIYTIPRLLLIDLVDTGDKSAHTKPGRPLFYESIGKVKISAPGHGGEWERAGGKEICGLSSRAARAKETMVRTTRCNSLLILDYAR